MPLTGNRQKDIPELMSRCKSAGKFGMQKKSSFKVCQKRALAAAYSASRRKGRR